MDLRKVLNLETQEFIYINFDQIVCIKHDKYMDKDVIKIHLADCTVIITNKIDLTPANTEDIKHEPSFRKKDETDIQFRDRVKDKFTKWINKQN